MTEVLAQWRASYAPGSWIALSGPTSLVVLLPSVSGWTPLLDTVWHDVLESTSIVELAATLSQHGLGAMPSFGAFFWTPAGMRSLVRGAVVVRDARTGEVVADGHGIQTWSEIGLSGLERIRIETSGDPAGPGLELPLVVGAALASSLTLDARADVSVPSPQEASTQDPEPRNDSDEVDTEPMSAAERAAMENGDTEQISAPLLTPPEDRAPATQPLSEAAPAPRLVLSDGTVIDLHQPVRIGRAPNAQGAQQGDLLLVTVRSPQQDISRTHLEVVAHEGQVVVTDLGSTNGTTVTRPGATVPERLAAGVGVAVPLGSLLDIGDNVSIRIEPSTAPGDH